MQDCKLMNIYELEDYNEDYMDSNSMGLLFCFGTSFISKLIMAKTRLYNNEIIPSHVALITKDLIYESTTSVEEVDNKTIRQGVRRWQMKDFIKVEKDKLTKYVYVPHKFSIQKADSLVHLPYGKDTILDFLLKDGSDGDSKGLICSQFANICILNHHYKSCPTPADLFRAEIQRHQLSVYE